jgi:RNA polymerase sigma factor (sigma-70 family)
MPTNVSQPVTSPTRPCATPAGHHPRPTAAPPTWSDEDLLLLVRSGDPAAFGELYRRYEHDARRFARSLVARDDVEDVVAESFTKMLRALNRGKGPQNHPVRYLMVTVRTTAASLHGRRARVDKTVLKLSNEADGIEAQFSVEDTDLVQAFQSLHPRWRQVIWWTEIEGLGPAEVADRMGLSPSAASALAYRARRALREGYAEHCAATAEH